VTTSTQQVKTATTAAQSEIERLILESDYAGKQPQIDGDVKMAAVATKQNGQVNLGLTLVSSRMKAGRRLSLWTVRVNVNHAKE